MIKNILRLVVENIPETIYQVFDQDLQILGAFGEKKLEEIGLSSSKMRGKKISEVHPAELTALFAPMCKQLFSLQRSNHIYYAYEGKTWEHTFLPVKDEEGTIIAGMIMSQDISKREEGEKRLKEMHDRLYEIGWIASHKVRGPVATMEGLINLVASHELNPEISALIENMRVPISELYEIVRRIDSKAGLSDNINIFL